MKYFVFSNFRPRLLPLLPVLVASVFAAWGMHFELSFPEMHYNDGTFHLSVLKMLDLAVSDGKNPLDFWYNGTPFGFPLFRDYQYFPYLLMYGIYIACFKVFSLAQVFAASSVVLAAALPWSVYAAFRLARMEKTDAAVAALASVLISDGGEFGLGLQNFTFGTRGIYTQLWSLVFLPPAIALSCVYVRDGKYFAPSLPFGFLTFGCHVVAAFILLFSIGFLTAWTAVAGRTVKPLRRLGMYLVLLALVTMHQWLFVMMDAPYINRSIIEPSWKFEGRGLGYVLSLLWKGDSLDAGRVPVLTAFLFIGCCAALFQPQKSSFVKKSFWLCLLFLSLYAGHDVWGFLFKNLPLLGSLHTHRMSIGFQLFGLALIGTGVGAILRISQPRRVAHALAIILIAAAFWFPVKERTDLFLHARRLRTGAGEFVEKKGGWIEPLISRLVSDNTGIVYAGANHNWGKQVEQFGIPFHYFPTAAGLSTVGGALYHSLAMAGDTLFDFDVRKKSHFRLYGIASVIAPSSWQGLRGFEKQADFNGLSLWRTNYGPLHSGLKSFSLCGPRANAPQFMRHWVQSRLVERSEYGVLTLDDCAPGNSDSSDRTVPYSAPVPPGLRTEGTNNDRIEVLPPYRPWKIRGLVDLRTSRLVVAATGFHPGWKVSIDGQPGDTLWVTPGFTAAEVPTGKHEIDFEYQGSTLKVYLFLMSIGILVYVSQKNRFPLPPSVM